MTTAGLCLRRFHTVRRIISWLKDCVDFLGSILLFLLLLFRLRQEERKRKRDQHKEPSDGSDGTSVQQ
jgi:hypothetical protein